MFRFIILFSYIIPIGLRVNLDLGKIVYSWFIQRDAMIPGTVVRLVLLNQIFRYTRRITPKSVTNWRGLSPRHCVSGQQSSFRKNLAAVASRWQHCVRLDRHEI